jgi:endonuclease YncB( thermonuclease family)
LSKHWRPDGKIVRIVAVREGRVGPWGSPEHYLPARRDQRLLVVAMLGGAVFVGAGAGWLLNRDGGTVPAQPASPIEWNAVQAVPTRTPDADDLEWQKRAKDLAAAAEPEPAAQTGSRRTTGGRNDGVTVIDGDTFVMGGQRIRVAGIDAPETHPARCGDEARLGLAATQKLSQLLSSGAVTMSGTFHDKYGRDVRQVRVGGRDVAEIMIGAGLARSYDGAKRQPWC